MINSYEELQKLFTKPEDTTAGVAFGNPPGMPTFDEAKVIVYGVCFDDTATCGKGSERGPEALRHASARQIETLVLDEGIDVYEKVPIFDLGDLKIRHTLSEEERKALQSEEGGKEKLKKVLEQFEVLKEVTPFIVSRGKIPLMIGGEHTLSYWPLCAVGEKKTVVIHFDAHRDAKEVYMGMKLCHTTPMYHFLKKFKTDFIQIGIRQADQQEEDFAKKTMTTFYPADVKKDLDSVKRFLKEKTRNRDVYITFDIDVLDICYTPCTGTPEPFGLTPDEVVELFKAIDPSARLIGADFVEVAVKNDDFREGTIAVQLLLRLLAREYVK